MSDRSAKFRLGLFVAGAFTLLAGMIVLFGTKPTLFSGRVRYVILFPEAPGLTSGTPVRKSGVRIGEVRTIELDDATGTVRVTVEVEGKYLPRYGEEPAISRGILSGDTTLDFVPKAKIDPSQSASRYEAYPAESEIKGLPPVNTRVLLNQASGVIPTAQESVARLLQSLDKMEKVLPAVEKTFEETAELAKAGREFVPELRKTNSRLQELLGETPPGEAPANVRLLLKETVEFMKAVRPAAEEIRTLVKDNSPEVAKTLSAVRRTAESADDLLNPENRRSISGTLKNIQAASDDLTKTIRLVALVADQSEKTLKELNARLAQSERVLNNVDRITTPLAEGAPELASDLRGLAKNLHAASDRLAKTLIEAESVLKMMNREGGTLQKVLSDPSLYNNLNDTTTSAIRTLARVERIAQDLQVFADKIARRPELIGVGGAFRPSTGLKESPDTPLPPSAPLPIAPQRPPVGPVIRTPSVTPFAPDPYPTYRASEKNDLPPPPAPR